MIEVEVKYRLRDKNGLIEKLTRAGYQKDKTLHQVDEVFLVKSDHLTDYSLGDPVTRIRTVDSAKTLLTYKRAIDGDVRIEHEIEVSPVVEARALLLELGYKLVATVDKVRIEYKYKDITVTIDTVKGLGDFAEIEIVCKEGQQAAADAKVKKVSGELGLKARDIEPLKYDQLVARLDDTS